MGPDSLKNKIARWCRWLNPRVLTAWDLAFMHECNEQNLKTIEELQASEEDLKKRIALVTAQAGTAATLAAAAMLRERKTRMTFSKAEQERAIETNLHFEKADNGGIRVFLSRKPVPSAPGIQTSKEAS